MRKPHAFTALTLAALCGGLTMGTATSAVAAPVTAPPAPPAQVAPAEQPPLTVDKGTVRAGATVTFKLVHGQEGINWISSPAFAGPEENPFDPDEYVARIVQDADGVAKAVATIADVEPGTYRVHTRVGGGKGPELMLKVVE